MWNASFSTRQFVNQWQEIVSEFHYYKQFEKEEASSVVYETNAHGEVRKRSYWTS